MKELINIDSWHRLEYYQYFGSLDNPFFGVVADIDCSTAYTKSHEIAIPFSTVYLYAAMKAVNTIKELRYRIEENEVVLYDTIHASSTIIRKDHTFAFTFIHYDTSLTQFAENVRAEKNRIMKTEGLGVTEDTERVDVVHTSPVPWISFSGITHARNYGDGDSIPKISFGKYYKDSGKLWLPVSLDVHHGLADGYHAGRFYELMQQCMDTPAL